MQVTNGNLVINNTGCNATVAHMAQCVSCRSFRSMDRVIITSCRTLPQSHQPCCLLTHAILGSV